MGEPRRVARSRRELLGYLPLVLLALVTLAIAATTVAFNLGGG